MPFAHTLQQNHLYLTFQILNLHLMKQNTTDQPRFIFNKLQITIIGTYIFIIVCITWPIAYFQFSQFQQQKHHLSYMKQSLFTPFLGILRDGHDPQWESFRSNLPVTICLILFSLLFPLKKYQMLLGLAISIAAFRADALIYYFIILSWYYFTKIFYQTKLFVPICWILTIVLLFINEKTDHFRQLSNYIQDFIPQKLSFFNNSARMFHWAQILNMNLLKMLSFSIDNHRGDQRQSLVIHFNKCRQCQKAQKNQKLSQLCQKGRDLLPNVQMTLVNFLSYILFPPTLFAGPPISYKCFHSFVNKKTNKKPGYLNWIAILISFQFYQHIFPYMAPNEDQSLIMSEIASLLNLVFIWFKFLVIWRTYRLWSLMLGVDVIDNLPRCVCNNYGFQGFWRMWHRGFNHWLLRYLYIPLGGKKNYLSVICVICFVAFWHDHTITIVLWALIIVIFMLPQLTIKRYFRNNINLHKYYSTQWFKYLCALICGIYIYIMSLVNLIAFGYGKEKAWLLINKCFSAPFSLMISILSVSLACILMFYQRNLQNGQKNY